jgi:ABC-type siderophore export system fused ATPase/permease subunit
MFRTLFSTIFEQVHRLFQVILFKNMSVNENAQKYLTI